MTEPTLLAYQLSILKSEFDHRTRLSNRGARSRLGVFLRRHARQFRWTLQRAVGLSDDERQRVTFKGADDAQTLPRRLLVDVSSTFSSPMQTGIQRVVTEFANACTEARIGLPVLVRKGGLFRADESGEKLQLVDIRPGDMLFLLDSSWRRLDLFRAIIRDVQARGGTVVACLYDMIPIDFPSTCNRDTVEHFTAWLDVMLCECDAFLCISKTTAHALTRYAATHRHRSKRPAIGWFKLGAQLPSTPQAHPRTTIERAWPRAPYVLMVGTLEPRKGHTIALDALETLWRQGLDLNLVIVGRRGWNMRFFEELLARHPENGKRLFWVTDADDDELHCAYHGAKALIYPSIAEGYGLPIIEAAAMGTQVIVSDLDIFREIAPPDAIFFRPCDPIDLAAKIGAFLGDTPLPTTRWIAPSWADSVANAYEIISEQSYQLTESVTSP